MNKPLRLTLIASRYKMQLYQSLASYLPGRFQIDFVSADVGYGGRFLPLTKRIWYLPSKRLLDMLVRFRPDVVLTDYPAYPSWHTELYSYLRRKRVPLIVWLLGDFWTEQLAFFSTRSRASKLLRPFSLFEWSSGLGLANHILCVCKWLEGVVNRRFPEKRTSVLYQGIDPKFWFMQNVPRYSFKHPAVAIVQDNNIMPKVRGLLWFSEVVKSMPEVHFYIAGGGPYTAMVEKAYSPLKNAHFFGRLSYPDGVRKLYLSSDLYVLPSGLDCCPTTLLEASACAKPIVASRIGGIPELIEQGKTGWTIPNGRAEEWVSTMRSVLEDPRLARSVGRNAQQFVTQHFSWETQASKLGELLRQSVLS